MFDEIILEEPQKNLLVRLVEAERGVTIEERGSWLVLQSCDPQAIFIHPSGRVGNVVGLLEDAETLAEYRLLRQSLGSRGSPSFFITSMGFKYYEELMAAGTPVEAVEAAINRHLSAEEFRREFPDAYEKWSQAQALLWSSDSLTQHTTIGHLCRESIQMFAAALAQQLNSPGSPVDRAKTIDNLRSVLDARRQDVGKAEADFLKALLGYWGTVSDLAQRQEHGAQREGDALSWEDSRRLVFQTCIVMYEVHRALSRGASPA